MFIPNIYCGSNFDELSCDKRFQNGKYNGTRGKYNEQKRKAPPTTTTKNKKKTNAHNFLRQNNINNQFTCNQLCYMYGGGG